MEKVIWVATEHGDFAWGHNLNHADTTITRLVQVERLHGIDS